MGNLLLDLTPDLAAGPPRGVDVDVGEAGSNGVDELRHGRRLTGVDALSGRPDHIDCRDHAGDRSRDRAGGLPAAAAQECGNAAVDATRSDMDVRGAHHPVGDEGRGTDALEISVTE